MDTNILYVNDLWITCRNKQTSQFWTSVCRLTLFVQLKGDQQTRNIKTRDCSQKNNQQSAVDKKILQNKTDSTIGVHFYTDVFIFSVSHTPRVIHPIKRIHQTTNHAVVHMHGAIYSCLCRVDHRQSLRRWTIQIVRRKSWGVRSSVRRYDVNTSPQIAKLFVLALFALEYHSKLRANLFYITFESSHITKICNNCFTRGCLYDNQFLN